MTPIDTAKALIDALDEAAIASEKRLVTHPETIRSAYELGYLRGRLGMLIDKLRRA